MALSQRVCLSHAGIVSKLIMILKFLLGVVACPLWFCVTTCGCDKWAGEPVTQVDLEIIGLKAQQWQCPNELPILSLPPHERVQKLPPIVWREVKYRQCSVPFARLIFSLRLCHSHGYTAMVTIKSVCRPLLADAVLGVQ